MNVIRADVMGMCFGVRDALEGDRRRRGAGDGDDPRPARPQRGGVVGAVGARVRHDGGGRPPTSPRQPRRPDHRARGQRPRARPVDGGGQAADRHHLPARHPRPPGRAEAPRRRLFCDRGRPAGSRRGARDRRGPGALRGRRDARRRGDVPGRADRRRLPDDRPRARTRPASARRSRPRTDAPRSALSTRSATRPRTTSARSNG